MLPIPGNPMDPTPANVMTMTGMPQAPAVMPAPMPAMPAPAMPHASPMMQDRFGPIMAALAARNQGGGLQGLPQGQGMNFIHALMQQFRNNVGNRGVDPQAGGMRRFGRPQPGAPGFAAGAPTPVGNMDMSKLDTTTGY